MSRIRHGLFTADRALPLDVLYFASKVPSARAEMPMSLGALEQARRLTPCRVSWPAIFLRAQAMVADESPRLRQACLRFPLLHRYEHQRNVAMLAIEREYRGTARLFWGRIVSPERQSLAGIQARIDHYQTGPVEQVFRKQLRMSRFPMLARRTLWWGAMNVLGRVRERQVGTFSLSTLAGQGVINRDHPSMLTSSLTYGPLDDHGQCLVTLIYDHRILDGMDASRALRRLRQILQQEIPHLLRAPAKVAA